MKPNKQNRARAFFFLSLLSVLFYLLSSCDSPTSGGGDTTAPVLSEGSVNRTSDTEAAISFTSDEAGTAYYVQLASGAEEPANTAVRADVNSLGAAAVGANSKDVTLTAGVRDIYVVVEDKSGNISEPLKIEAAAYVDDDDVDAPVLSAGSVSRTSDTEATISFTTDEAGTAYYVELASGAAAPTSATVKSDVNSLGAVTVGANTGKAVTLAAGARDIYIVVEDAAGNISIPLKISVAAHDPGDTTAPVLSAGSVSRTSDTAAIINFDSSEAGTAYYVQLATTDPAPTGAAVKAANTSLGAAMIGANTGKAVILTAGVRHIYVVVEDDAGNISNPLRITAAAYVPPDTIAPILSAGSVIRTSDTEAEIDFTTDETGTAYYVELTSGEATPTSAVVATGSSLGTVVVGANTGKAVTLTAGARDIYVVVEDAAGNISDPLHIIAAAYILIDTTPPTLSSGNVNRTSDIAATISFTTDEAGTAYYLVLANGASAPASAVVKAGTSLGAATLGANSKAVTLTAGARDIYVVVEDEAGNISAPLKIEAAAYDSSDPWAGFSAGLYPGAPASITASGRIDSVTSNDLAAAVDHAKANPAEYTLLIGTNINAGAQNLNVANVKLTIIGIGQKRTVQYYGADNGLMFTISASGASLTLGNNITLRGIATSTTQLIFVTDAASLTMLTGSIITGHTTSDFIGTVSVAGKNSSFTMEDGEITGNHSSFIGSGACGGVMVWNDATFTMIDGSITGNTLGSPPTAMDVYLDVSLTNATKTGGFIGVSYPAGFAGN